MATNRVMVELDEPKTLAEDVATVRDAVPTHNFVSVQQGRVVVDVPDSRDAEDEITSILDKAGVRCMVYAYDSPDLLA